MAAKKFMLFEDNGDGTITVTANIDFGEGNDVHFLLPFSIDDMSTMFSAQVLQESEEKVLSKAVLIPNSPEVF